MSEWEEALERITFRTLPPHPVEDAAIIRAEVERLRGALRLMLDGCNEGVHHGPCADCEERARAALEGKP